MRHSTRLGAGAFDHSIVTTFHLSCEYYCVARHEVNEARRYGIPIIVVVDTDKQTSREVIDRYMEKGYSWLFDSQASCFLF